MSTASHRLTCLLVAWRIPLLLLAVLIGVASYWLARDVRFDRSIENMFAPDDPLLAPYAQLKRTFGGNEIVLAVYIDPQLLNPDCSGIRRLAQISSRLEAVEGVKGVLSLERPLGEAIVEPDNFLAERNRKLFEGYTHGIDGKTIAIACMLNPQAEARVPRRQTIDQLRAVMETLPGGLPPGLLTGEPVMVADGFRYVEEDGRRLGFWSLVFLGLTIILCFRSVRWVLIPVAVVQLALLMTKALLSLADLHLSMVSSMLTAIVTVVGVATMVHVIVRFREGRVSGLAPREALIRTGTLLAAPIFWACSTDAVGFASLAVAEVGPVQDFGIMMAAGALMVIVSVALLVPGLVLLGRFDTDPRQAWGEDLLDWQLGRVVDWVQRRPKTVAAVSIGVTCVALVGVFRLEVETDFTKNFRSQSPIVRAYELVETDLGGAGVCDIVIPAPPQLRWEYLKQVLALEKELRAGAEDAAAEPQRRGLTKVLSLADAVAAAAPIDIDRVRPKIVRDAVVSRVVRKMESTIPEFFRALYGQDPERADRHYLRIMLRTRERQPSQEKRRLIEQLGQVSRRHFPQAQVTGFFVLLTNLIDSIIRDQWLTFGVAIVGIGLMMVVALRSGVLAVVALVPNALPIIIVTGLMGWANLKINMGAAMIAAVSMGLSIDSSIHYITSFQRARREGQTLRQALGTVHHSVGRAMVFSTLALIVGFTVLCTSQFVPTIYFGVLVSLAMLGGLAGNLILLPLLLMLVCSDKSD